MIKTSEEQLGLLALTNIMSSVWLGDWDTYEAIFEKMDDNLKAYFPFHNEYERENVKLWHDNHFSIPGRFFIPPYYSAYKRKNEHEEEKKKKLLCLIGNYEERGYYFPLQQQLYPDHIGCMIGFIGAIQKEKLRLLDLNEFDEVNSLKELELDVAKNYVWPLLHSIRQRGAFKHPFFEKFLDFSLQTFSEEYIL